MIKPEDFKAKMDEVVANLTDQAKVTTILGELTSELTTGFSELTTAQATATKLTEDNEKLRDANMKLFLKVGEQPSNQNNSTNNNQQDETPKFESLFNDKGELI